MEQTQGAVVLDAEYVRMAADKQLWRTLHKFAAYAGVVSARITANVLHQHLHILTLEAQHFGKHTPQFGTVAIAIHSTQGTYGSQLLCHFGRCRKEPELRNGDADQRVQ